MFSVDYSISLATINEAEEIASLVNSAYRGDSSREGWTTEADLLDGTRVTKDLIEEIIQRRDSIILKYVNAGQLLGCVELTQNERGLYLGMLTVSPSKQGKGIGKILLKASEEYAITLGTNSIYMTVISVRRDLIKWYCRNGYIETGEHVPFKVPDERWGIPKFKLEFTVLEKLVIKRL